MSAAGWTGGAILIVAKHQFIRWMAPLVVQGIIWALSVDIAIFHYSLPSHRHDPAQLTKCCGGRDVVLGCRGTAASTPRTVVRKQWERPVCKPVRSLQADKTQFDVVLRLTDALQDSTEWRKTGPGSPSRQQHHYGASVEFECCWREKRLPPPRIKMSPQIGFRW